MSPGVYRLLRRHKLARRLDHSTASLAGPARRHDRTRSTQAGVTAAAKRVPDSRGPSPTRSAPALRLAYLRWREDCHEVRDAYATWTTAHAAATRAHAYKDFVLALDEEEKSAARCAQLLGFSSLSFRGSAPLGCPSGSNC
jgi:hypothetical protein